MPGAGAGAGAGGRPVPRRVTLLVNPAAGGRRGGGKAAAAARRLLAHGVEVDVVAGRDAAEARARARAAVSAGADVLAVAGGDGLVHLALQEVAGTGTALAVLPSGTGNDFARVLGIPRADPAAAADVITGGVARTLDLGRANAGDGGGPCWFGTVLTSGFDSLVTDRTNRMRWPRGRARYNLAVLAELGVLRPRPYLLELDGERSELSAVLIAVGNTTTYGGGMRICPHAATDDGRLAVTVVGPAGVARLVRAFPRLYRGTHVSDPLVATFHARRVRVHTEAMRAYADGELVGALPVTAEAVPSAVRVLVPETAAGRGPGPVVGAGG
ncbi:diacylglycerol kinase [Streptomyces sp. TRM 70351]|uniref:diacylglycerol kinase n=1 Tax=Streptomyces sp. TRM 70351 TaxID=3116552 RepID=UPI002E7B949D|nr:diacylglycerol kinase [Streptomyces sp. TRM 70351]MEE1927409.1 diacylglycerol kinase [Streptomyces sp. TRM 70351]